MSLRDLYETSDPDFVLYAYEVVNMIVSIKSEQAKKARNAR